MKTKTIIIIIAFLFAIGINANAQKKIKILKELKNFAFIPAGKVRVDTMKYDVQAFYISKFEVSNIQYREFLDSLFKDGELVKRRIAGVDATGWAKVNGNKFPDAMSDYYSTHPAYNDYPVVNISYEGVLMYCQWLTKKYNALNKNKSIEYNFTLPTKLQWIRAARGSSTFEYSWMKMGKNRDGIQGNFKFLNYENIHFNQQTQKYEIINTFISKTREEDLTAPVKSYWPNMFGVYNMCGNAAEMILEKGIAIGGSYNDPGYDVRVESIQSYQGATPFIGFRPVMIVIKM